MDEKEIFENEEIVEIEETDDGFVSFADLGLDERTLKAVEKKGFSVPSPIQVLAIPRLLNGDANVIARARTGTGKTAAFGLPLVQTLREKNGEVQALVLEPTRELAMQTCTEMESFSDGGFPRTCVLYGGASYSTQIKDLRKGTEIVVGTPGRIKDHLERKTLDISKIKYFILDEGDEMLDMGFIEDIEEIFEKANPDCRILLFSATMPEPILKIAQKFMGEYEIVEEEGVVDEPLLIDQKFWMLKESDKIEALVRLIDMAPDFYGLVFTMTKNDADNVTRLLDLRGYEAAALHGDIMQNQREKVLERFRLKKTRILVATDVAARGIDITGLTHVVNYSIPFDGATYVHRIGRTGRAGSSGTAVTFVRPDERRKLSFLQNAVAKASKGKMIEEAVPSVDEVLNVKRERLLETLKNQIFEQAANLPNGDSSDALGMTQGSENEDPVILNEDPVILNECEGSPLGSLPNGDSSDALGMTEGSENETPAAPSIIEVDPYFQNLAEKLCEGQDAREVVGALLNAVYGQKLSRKHYGRISQIPSKGGRDGGRGDAAVGKDQLRVFVSMGKKDGYHPRDIADFFSNLLHIPGRKVDAIDMAREFSLVNLPKEAAKKAVEISKRDKSVPHIHLDVKSGDLDRSPRRKGYYKNEEGGERKEGRERDGRRGGRPDRDFKDGKKEGKGGERGRSKGSRPNVHTQSTRNAASLYKKSSPKAERF